MTIHTYHILNGDALREQFPSDLKGELIIARECLVDADELSLDHEKLYHIRAAYLNKHYGEITYAQYCEKSKSQFDIIRRIPPGSHVNLWFEQDVFCQVNLWYIFYLIDGLSHDMNICLVMPPQFTQYGFGALDANGLLQAHEKKVVIRNLIPWVSLWECYVCRDLDKLLEVANTMTDFPFVKVAVSAYIDSIDTYEQEGYPKQVLRQLIVDKSNDSFGKVFQAFSHRCGIYGYGDTMVKRWYDEMVAEK